MRLAQTWIGTNQLIGLRVGDVITTQKDVQSSLVVSVEGLPKFHARAGAFKGHKAICIQDVIENPADEEAEVFVHFDFPAENTIFDDFKFELAGEEQQVPGDLFDPQKV